MELKFILYLTKVFSQYAKCGVILAIVKAPTPGIRKKIYPCIRTPHASRIKCMLFLGMSK